MDKKNPPKKLPDHTVKPGSSLSWSQEAFQHTVEPGSTFETKTKDLPAPDQAKMDRTIRSMLTPELAEMFPDQSKLDSMIGPAEQKTLQRIIDKKMKPEMPPMENGPFLDGVPSAAPLEPAPPSLPPTSLGPKIRTPKEHLAHAKLRLSKRRAKLKLKETIRKHGPQGEQLSMRLSDKPTVMLPLDKIAIDPGFKYFRLPPTPEDLAQLIESMRTEGIMIPIKVIQILPTRIPGSSDLASAGSKPPAYWDGNTSRPSSSLMTCRKIWNTGATSSKTPGATSTPMRSPRRPS